MIPPRLLPKAGQRHIETKTDNSNAVRKLDRAQRTAVLRCFQALFTTQANFINQMMEALPGDALHSTWRDVWRALTSQKGSGRPGKDKYLDVVIAVTKELNPPEFFHRQKEDALKLLKWLQGEHNLERGIFATSAAHPCIYLMPCRHDRSIDRAAEPIQVPSGYRIGRAVTRSRTGYDDRTIAVVDVDQDTVHSVFAELNYRGEKWWIICLGQRRPLKVNHKLLPYEQSRQLSYGDLVTLSERYHFTVSEHPHRKLTQ